MENDATLTEYNTQDEFTGKIKGNNCKGIEKRTRVLAQYDLKQYSEIIAYANSWDDKELMELATVKNWI